MYFYPVLLCRLSVLEGETWYCGGQDNFYGDGGRLMWEGGIMLGYDCRVFQSNTYKVYWGRGAFFWYNLPTI